MKLEPLRIGIPCDRLYIRDEPRFNGRREFARTGRTRRRRFGARSAKVLVRRRECCRDTHHHDPDHDWQRFHFRSPRDGLTGSCKALWA